MLLHYTRHARALSAYVTLPHSTCTAVKQIHMSVPGVHHIAGHITNTQATTTDTLTSSSRQIKHVKPPPLTHFISLPITSPHLSTVYTQFCHDTQSSAGMDPTMYADTRSMHMTLLVLSLPTPQHIHTTTATLTACATQLQQIAAKQSMQLTFTGVDTFQTDRRKCKVLYAVPQRDTGLTTLSAMTRCILRSMLDHQVITDRTFRQQYTTGHSSGGQIVEEQYTHDMLNIKYHLTLINTKYKRQKPRSRTPYTFDATDILQLYGDVQWGEVQMQEIQLCKMERDKQTMKYKIESSVRLTRDAAG